MASEEHQLLLNRATNEYRAALKKLDECRALLEVIGEEEAAATLEMAVADLNLRMEARKCFARVAKQAKKKQLPTKHPLQDFLIMIWKEMFPDYGEPTPRDRKELKNFFIEFQASHPHAKGKAGEVLIRRMINNFRLSTADFTSTKRLFTFARNYTHFVAGPALQRGSHRVDRRDDGGARVTEAGDGIRLPGFAGIIIPAKGGPGGE